MSIEIASMPSDVAIGPASAHPSAEEMFSGFQSTPNRENPGSDFLEQLVLL